MSNCLSYSAIFMSIISGYYPIELFSYKNSEVMFYFYGNKENQTDNNPNAECWIWITDSSIKIDDKVFNLPNELHKAVDTLLTIIHD